MQKNWLEWTTFTVALVLVTGTIGYLIFDAVTTRPTPPRLAIHLGKPQRMTTGGSEQFLVPVTVTNRGGQTAQGVQIEVTLARAGHAPEEAGFEIPFMPRQATRHGGVTFRSDPRQGRLQTRILGYEES
ncbi:MAG TPA: TIGR02588 family protein [Abditibacteriaceae bacterium]|nr:TIGR02588 family protein [Abditibacteriaceae bacterium]